jgi:hypothetical protein
MSERMSKMMLQMAMFFRCLEAVVGVAEWQLKYGFDLVTQGTKLSKTIEHPLFMEHFYDIYEDVELFLVDGLNCHDLLTLELDSEWFMIYCGLNNIDHKLFAVDGYRVGDFRSPDFIYINLCDTTDDEELDVPFIEDEKVLLRLNARMSAHAMYDGFISSNQVVESFARTRGPIKYVCDNVFTFNGKHYAYDLNKGISIAGVPSDEDTFVGECSTSEQCWNSHNDHIDWLDEQDIDGSEAEKDKQYNDTVDKCQDCVYRPCTSQMCYAPGGHCIYGSDASVKAIEPLSDDECPF